MINNLNNYTNNIAKINKLDRFNNIINILEKNNIKYTIQKAPSFNALGNIIVQLNPSQSKKIVVSAHYDNFPGTPGANDNAAACSILLNLIINNKNKEDYIECVFFDLEEYGCIGSTYYVYLNNDNIDYVINLDMCGVGENIIYSHYSLNNSSKINLNNIIDKHKAINVEILPYGDAYSFMENGIETFYIINSTNKDVQWFKNYYKGINYGIPDFAKTMHTPNDIVENLNFDQIEKIYMFIFDLLENYNKKK